MGCATDFLHGEKSEMRIQGLEKNKLNDSDVNSVPDARRKFAAETNLSARICNAADGMLFTSESFSLFFSSPLV